MNREEVLKKYYREIYMAKLQIIERFVRMNEEEIKQITLLDKPRNRCEEVIKDNYMSFISQRLLEGYSKTESCQMAKDVVDEAIKEALDERYKKRRPHLMKIFKRR